MKKYSMFTIVPLLFFVLAGLVAPTTYFPMMIPVALASTSEPIMLQVAPTTVPLPPPTAPVWSIEKKADVSAYTTFIPVTPFTPIAIPKVVEITFGEMGLLEYQKADPVVIDDVTGVEAPSRSISRSIPQPVKFSGVASSTYLPGLPGVPYISRPELTDESLSTFVTFPLSSSGKPATTILGVSLASPRRISGFSYTLAPNVALPDTVEVRALAPNNDPTVVLSQTAITHSPILFPETMTGKFDVILSHRQPLRVAEMAPIELRPQTVEMRVLRFLAQPGRSYQVYGNPDRYFPATYSPQAQNLSVATDIVKGSLGVPFSNPAYLPSDQDRDGVIDTLDNCPAFPNTDQNDLDQNRKGDACEDFDYDVVMNNKDNCRDIQNADQRDSDSDGVGDACDTIESRFTEAYPWIPWVGILAAALVLIVLFVLTAKAKGLPNTPS